MSSKPLHADKKLYSVAETQQGFFTTQQALKAGFLDANHGYHVRNGDWEHICRGVYRLAQYPPSPDSEYVIWSLWSRNRSGVPQGVYSHLTALTFFDLSDANPAKLHMTVPRGFRRHSGIPKILVLHYGELLEDDTQERHGYRVTRPMRTISDLISDGSTDSETIKQALEGAWRRRLISRNELERLSKEFPQEKALFSRLLSKVK